MATRPTLSSSLPSSLHYVAGSSAELNAAILRCLKKSDFESIGSTTDVFAEIRAQVAADAAASTLMASGSGATAAHTISSSGDRTSSRSSRADLNKERRTLPDDGTTTNPLNGNVPLAMLRSHKKENFHAVGVPACSRSTASSLRHTSSDSGDSSNESEDSERTEINDSDTLRRQAELQCGLIASVPQRASEGSVNKAASTQRQLQQVQSVISSLQYHFLPCKPFFNLKKNRPIKSIIATGREAIAESLPIRCLEATFVGIHLTQHMAAMGVGMHCPMAEEAYFGSEQQHQLLAPLTPLGGCALLASPLPGPSNVNSHHVHIASSGSNTSSSTAAPMRFPLAFKSVCRGKVYRHIVLAVYGPYERGTAAATPVPTTTVGARRAAAISQAVGSAASSGTGAFGALGLSRRCTLMDKLPCHYPSLVSLTLEYERQYCILGHRLVSVKVGLPVSYDKAFSQVVPCWRFITVKLPLLANTKAATSSQATSESQTPTLIKSPTFPNGNILAVPSTHATVLPSSCPDSKQQPPPTSAPTPTAGGAFNCDYPPSALSASGRALMCLQGMLGPLANQYYEGDSSDFEPPPTSLNTGGGCGGGGAPQSSLWPTSPSKSQPQTPTDVHLTSNHPPTFHASTTTPPRKTRAGSTGPAAPLVYATPSVASPPDEEDDGDDSDTELNKRRGMCVLYGKSPLHPSGKYTAACYATLGQAVLGGPNNDSSPGHHHGHSGPNSATNSHSNRMATASTNTSFSSASVGGTSTWRCRPTSHLATRLHRVRWAGLSWRLALPPSH